MLLNNERCLDDITKQQIYTDIYDDSEWLINIVENLLSITRLNDGRLKLKFTDQLLDEDTCTYGCAADPASVDQSGR